MAVEANDLLIGPLTPADGVTTISLDFYFENAEWLDVYKTGSETPLVLGNEYTVSGEGTGSGVVTLDEAADGSDRYSVYLSVPLERVTDMQLRGQFRSEPFNVELDRVWQAIQGLSTDYARTLRIGKTSTSVGALVAESAADRAGRAIIFSDDGTDIEVGFDGSDIESAQSYAERAEAAAANAALGTPYGFETVAALLADNSLSYTAGANKVVVAVGQIVLADRFRYVVAASAATDHDLTTPGGVKLYVLPNSDQSWSAEAFGVSAAATDNSAALIAMRNAAIRVGADKHHVFHWPLSGVIKYTNNRWANGLQSFHVKWYGCEPQCTSTKLSAGDAWTVGPREHMFRKAGEWFFTDYGNPTWVTTGSLMASSAVAGATTIVLAAGEGAKFAAGNRIFVHGFAMQKQGYTPNVKYFEWAKVKSVATDTLTLDVALDFSYDFNWPDFNAFAARAAYLGQSNPAQGLGKPRVINLSNSPQADGTTYVFPKYARFEGGMPKANPNLTGIEQLQFGAETVIWENVRPSHEGTSALRAWALVARESRMTRFIDCVGTGFSYYELDKCCGTVEIKDGSIGIEDTTSFQSVKAGTGCRRVIINGLECDGFINTTAIEGLTIIGSKASGKQRNNVVGRGPVGFYLGYSSCKVARIDGNTLTRLSAQSIVGSAEVVQTLVADTWTPASNILKFAWLADSEPPAVARYLDLGSVIWHQTNPSLRGVVTAISGDATHIWVTVGTGNLVSGMSLSDTLVVKPMQRIMLDGAEQYPFESFWANEWLLAWERAVWTHNSDPDDLQMVGTAITGTGGTAPAASDVSFPGTLLPGATYEMTYNCTYTAGTLRIRAGTMTDVATITASATGGTVSFTVPAASNKRLEIKQLVGTPFNGSFTPLKLRRI